MSKKSTTIILLLIIIMLIGVVVYLTQVDRFRIVDSTFEPEPLEPIEDEPIEIILDVEKAQEAVKSSNYFTLNFYKQIKDNQQNIFFSPYSLTTALAMTYEGARGETAEEMIEVFNFPEDNNIRWQAFFNLLNWLNRDGKNYELSIANALWAQKDFYFLPEYFDIIGEYYQGKIENLNFIEEPEESRLVINSWVEEQTKDKIKDLIPKNVINPLTRLILTNAIYFKGDWALEFKEGDTQEDDFHLMNGGSVKVQMMSRTDDEAEFSYHQDDFLQILEMPYKGEDISMLIILPKGQNLAQAEELLTLENLSDWQGQMRKQKVEVYFPKFKLETKYNLKDTLEDIGMPTAFSEEANFSGMNGKNNLLISEVIHQAFIEVDEKGTEAAAATGVVIGVTSLPLEESTIFKVDRPFVFLIQDKTTGGILFMGRVLNPNQ